MGLALPKPRCRALKVEVSGAALVRDFWLKGGQERRLVYSCAQKCSGASENTCLWLGKAAGW